MAIPSHPFHRPYRQPEDLGYRVDTAMPIPRVIWAIYELKSALPDAPITFTELRYNSEMNLFFLKSHSFDLLSRLANSVRLFRVSVPWNLERLDEVRRMIVEHSGTLLPRF